MKALLIASCMMVSFSVLSQDIVFITELELDYIKKEYNNALIRIPYNEFVNDYNLKFFFMDDHGNVSTKEAPVSMSENTVYNSDPYISPSALLFIRIPKSIMNGPVKLHAQILTNPRNELVGSKDITLSKPGTSSRYYLDTSMFWTPQALKIGFPEEVALNITTKYIQNLISKGSESGYYGIIQSINSGTKMTEKSSATTGATEEFYRFKLFVEPYLDNKFLKNEAVILRKQIDSLKTSQFEKDSKNNKVFVANLRRKEEVLSNYEKTMEQLKTYVLGANTYIQNLQPDKSLENVNENKLQKITNKHELAPGDSIKETKSSNRILNLALGVNASFPREPVYSVVVSPIDTTVRFDQEDRVNYSLSGGVLLEPFAKQNINITLGFFLLYYLNGNTSKPYENNNLGASIGLGTKISNLDVSFTMGFRKTRIPREFFVAKYKNEPQRPPMKNTIDYGDDNIFINKNIINYGLSFSYRFHL